MDVALDFLKTKRAKDLIIGGIAVAMAGAAAQLGQRMLSEVCNSIYNCFVVSVEVKSTQEAFQWMRTWLSHKGFVSGANSLSVFMGYEERETKLDFAHSPGHHTFSFKGHFIWMNREQHLTKDHFHDKEILRFSTFANSTDVLKQMFEEAKQLATIGDGNCVSVFVPEPDGYWVKETTKKKRSFQSVILADDTHDRVLKDVQRFLSLRQWYEQKGLPYRRGYLFYGPPGCGKSSFLFTLASQLDLRVCYLSLAEPDMTDSLLNSLMCRVPAKSAVVLEDVDCMFDQNRDASSHKHSKVTFSGLLNAMDGIAAHEGLLLFMTTNHKEKLAPALIRPGRVDVQVYFGLASQAQAERLFDSFFPDQLELKTEFANKIPANSVSMARLQAHFLQYQDDPKGAAENVNEQLVVGADTSANATTQPASEAVAQVDNSKNL